MSSNRKASSKRMREDDEHVSLENALLVIENETKSKRHKIEKSEENQDHKAKNQSKDKKTGNKEKNDQSLPSQNTIKIVNLNTTTLKNWSIKARLCYKSNMFTYYNAKGSGKYFNVIFYDESCEIKATCFNKIAEKFHGLLSDDKVYLVSNGNVQLRNQSKYSEESKNDYEIIFNNDTQIIELENDDSIPKKQQKFNFVKFSKLKMKNDDMIDIIGFVIKTKLPIQINTAKGKKFKAEIELIDQSGYVLLCSLWNEETKLLESIDSSINNVIAFKSVKLTEYSGRSITTVRTSSVLINPELPEVKELKDWFDDKQNLDKKKFKYFYLNYDDEETDQNDSSDCDDQENKTIKFNDENKAEKENNQL